MKALKEKPHLTELDAQVILHDMDDGVITVKKDGLITTVNPAAAKILDISDESQKIGFADLFIGDSRNDQFVQAILDAVYNHHSDVRNVYRCHTRTGQTKILDVKTTYALEENGDKQLVIVFSDVTEREQNIIYHRDVTILMALILSVLCLYAFAAKALASVVQPADMTLGLLLVLLLGSIVASRTTSIHPVLWHGLKSERKDIIVSLVVSALIFVLMVIVKLIAENTGVLFNGSRPFIDFSKFQAKEIYRYIPSVLLQEYLARSFLQETLRRVFGEKYSWLVIAVSSLIFGAIHTHYGLTYMISAAALMALLGVFYERHRSLAAISIIHFIGAEAAIMLGFFG